MKDAKMNWTDEQKQAITHRGSNVFVTASAGTGKTAVLSGRCCDIVSCDGYGSSVMDMLVMTFTEAAAEQMRSRIADNIRKKISHQFLKSGFENTSIDLDGYKIDKSFNTKPLL